MAPLHLDFGEPAPVGSRWDLDGADDFDAEEATEALLAARRRLYRETLDRPDAA